MAVPTEFFQLAASVFDENMKTHAAILGVAFYLDQVGDSWVFGVETLDGKHHADLWLYTKSQLPTWAELALSKKR